MGLHYYIGKGSCDFAVVSHLLQSLFCLPKEHTLFMVADKTVSREKEGLSCPRIRNQQLFFMGLPMSSLKGKEIAVHKGL